LSLGVATGALPLLRARAGRPGGEAVASAADALEQETTAARAEVNAWAERPQAEGFREGVLRTRAWCIDLGVRAAHMAVVTSGGAANSLDHPAQRLFREAMLYSVTALTP